MPAKKFEDIVREYAEQQQKEEADAPALRKARLTWWQERVGKLLDDIDQWLSPLVKSGSVKIERPKVNLEEENIGRYDIVSGVIKLGPKTLTVNPLGTMIVGAYGRVDATGPNGKAMLLLLGRGGPTATAEEQKANAGWFISHPQWSAKLRRPQRRDLRELTQETFQDLFTDLFGIG